MPPILSLHNEATHNSSLWWDDHIPLPSKTTPYSLPTLLQWFDSQQWESYISTYRTLCKISSERCSKIQVNFSDLWKKEHYYSLISLLTLEELEQRLVAWGIVDTIVILKRDESKKRGYATKDMIVINTKELSDQEFFEVLTHELGHTVDLQVLQWSQESFEEQFTEFGEPSFKKDDPSLAYYALSRESEWIKKNSSSIEDFCTIYGAKNPFEDFSECFNLYINHHDYFISLIETNSILTQKYLLLSSWVRPFTGYISLSYNYNSDSSYRYRDSTKLPLKKEE